MKLFLWTAKNNNKENQPSLSIKNNLDYQSLRLKIHIARSKIHGDKVFC